MKQIDPPIEIGDVLINDNKEVVTIGYTSGNAIADYWIKQNRMNIGLYGNQTIEDIRVLFSAPRWKRATVEDLE